jgi:ElaB/YqjD/DUF883 family membrane-anchored ribosome-binding protein
MDNSPNSGHQYNPGNTRSDGFVDHAAVPMQGPLNLGAAPANGGARAAVPVIARVAEMAHQTVDKVAEVATPPAQWLSEKSETLDATRRTAVADARVYVSANPWQSLGVAVAVGFLLGRLAR